MTGLLRLLRWSALGLVALLLLVVVGVGIVTHTSRFREFLREKVVQTVNGSIRGSISVGLIEGTIWGNLIVRDLRVSYDDAVVLQIARARLSYSLLPLLWRRLQIFHVEGDEPVGNFEQDEQGQWNIVQALSSREPESTQSSGLMVMLESINLHDGEIKLTPSAAVRKTHLLKRLNVEAGLSITPDALTLDARRLAAIIVSPDLPELSTAGALNFSHQGVTTRVRVTDLALTTSQSRLIVTGDVSKEKSTEVHGKIALETVSASDIVRVLASWPIKKDLSGTAEVNGPLDALKVDLALNAAATRVSANVLLDVTQELPRYQGTLKLSGFNLATMLGRDDLSGVLGGTVRADGVGVNLGGIAAKGEISMQRAAVHGWGLGDISLQGDLYERTARISGNLKSIRGQGAWRGEISFKDRPVYDLAFSVDKLAIKKDTGGGNRVEGEINLKGTVKGSGIEPSQINARTEVQVLPSTVGQIKIEQGWLNAIVAEQRIRISRGALRSGDASITVAGDLGLTLQQNGQLDYRVRIPELAPWLALAGQTGGGSVDLQGRAVGNITSIKSQGTLVIAAVQARDASIKNGKVSFDLDRINAQARPQGTLQLQVTGVTTVVSLQRIDGRILLSGTQPYEIGLDLKIQDRSERTHALGARVSYGATEIGVRVDRLSLNLPDGLWRLEQDATITQRGAAIDIDRLVLRNGAQEVSLNGHWANTGSQNLVATVDGFPVAGLAAFMDKPLPITGVLAVRAHVSGSASAPQIAASVNLRNATFANQSYGGAVAEITYRERTAHVQLTIRQDADHTLTANGNLPLVLSWSPSWRAEPAGDMSVQVQSAGLSLAFVNAFAGDATQNINGTAALNVLVRGPIKNPVPRGTFALSNGTMTVKPLGVQLSAITMNGQLNAQTVSIQQISARAKDGTITGSGTVALKDYQAENFKVSLTASRWPVIDTQRYRATAAGSLELQGPLTRPLLTGQVNVISADLRPDLVFLNRGKTPLQRDDTIVVKQTVHAPQAAATDSAGANGKNSDLLKNARLDVSVSMANQIWIRHPDANVELAGKLRITKAPERDLALVGTINAVRGWIAFQGRRFNLLRGLVEFRGERRINPALDIVAQYRLPQYQVEAAVSGTLDKPALVLRSDPTLEQADILALLLFGKPINSLDRTEQSSLQQSAIDIAGGYAATTVATAVSEALGLDRLGVDIRDVDFSGGQVGFGRYIGQSTYISFSQALSATRGREVSLEYQIGVDWKITTSTTTDGSSGIGIIWHKRY